MKLFATLPTRLFLLGVEGGVERIEDELERGVWPAGVVLGLDGDGCGN